MRGRYPWIAAAQAHLREVRTIGPKRKNERRKVLLNRVGPALEEALQRGEIDTVDPRKIGENEVNFLVSWMDSEGFADGYKDTIWDHLNKFLKANHNTILEDLEDRGVWKRPKGNYAPPKVKDETWLRDTFRRLDAVEGWRGVVLRFVVAFFFGRGVRPCELRLADVDDLNVHSWTFRIMNPKPGSSRKKGDELDIYADTQIHVLDFLAGREKRLRAVGLDPRTVKALVPNENGDHYSEGGFRNLRWKTLRRLGLDPKETEDEWFSFKVLRATHEQILMDRLERDFEIAYRKGGDIPGAVTEIAAQLLGHTVETQAKHYAVLRTSRRRDAAKRAWESGARVQSGLIDAES